MECPPRNWVLTLLGALPINIFGGFQSWLSIKANHCLYLTPPRDKNGNTEKTVTHPLISYFFIDRFRQKMLILMPPSGWVKREKNRKSAQKFVSLLRRNPVPLQKNRHIMSSNVMPLRFSSVSPLLAHLTKSQVSEKKILLIHVFNQTHRERERSS